MPVIHTDLSITTHTTTHTTTQTTAQTGSRTGGPAGLGPAPQAATADSPAFGRASGRSAEPVAGVAGAVVVGRLAAIRARLVELFGSPTATGPLGEGGLVWVIDTPGGVAAVRAVGRHRARQPDLRHDPYAVISWQIVAHDARPLVWLCKTITGSTSTLATAAATATRTAGRHPRLGPTPTALDLVAAYTDYLALRRAAVHAQLSRTRRLSRSRRTLRRLHEQLSRQHSQLFDLLRHHQPTTPPTADQPAPHPRTTPLQTETSTGAGNPQLANVDGATTTAQAADETANRPHTKTSSPRVARSRRSAPTATEHDAHPDSVGSADLAGLLDQLARQPAAVGAAGSRGRFTARNEQEFRATLTSLATFPSYRRPDPDRPAGTTPAGGSA